MQQQQHDQLKAKRVSLSQTVVKPARVSLSEMVSTYRTSITNPAASASNISSNGTNSSWGAVPETAPRESLRSMVQRLRNTGAEKHVASDVRVSSAAVQNSNIDAVSQNISASVAPQPAAGSRQSLSAKLSLAEQVRALTAPRLITAVSRTALPAAPALNVTASTGVESTPNSLDNSAHVADVTASSGVHKSSLFETPVRPSGLADNIDSQSVDETVSSHNSYTARRRPSLKDMITNIKASVTPTPTLTLSPSSVNSRVGDAHAAHGHATTGDTGRDQSLLKSPLSPKIETALAQTRSRLNLKRPSSAAATLSSALPNDAQRASSSSTNTAKLGRPPLPATGFTVGVGAAGNAPRSAASTHSVKSSAAAANDVLSRALALAQGQRMAAMSSATTNTNSSSQSQTSAYSQLSVAAGPAGGGLSAAHSHFTHRYRAQSAGAPELTVATVPTVNTTQKTTASAALGASVEVKSNESESPGSVPFTVADTTDTASKNRPANGAVTAVDADAADATSSQSSKVGRSAEKVSRVQEVAAAVVATTGRLTAATQSNGTAHDDAEVVVDATAANIAVGSRLMNGVLFALPTTPSPAWSVISSPHNIVNSASGNARANTEAANDSASLNAATALTTSAVSNANNAALRDTAPVAPAVPGLAASVGVAVHANSDKATSPHNTSAAHAPVTTNTVAATQPSSERGVAHYSGGLTSSSNGLTSPDRARALAAEALAKARREVQKMQRWASRAREQGEASLNTSFSSNHNNTSFHADSLSKVKSKNNNSFVTDAGANGHSESDDDGANNGGDRYDNNSDRASVVSLNSDGTAARGHGHAGEATSPAVVDDSSSYGSSLAPSLRISAHYITDDTAHRDTLSIKNTATSAIAMNAHAIAYRDRTTTVATVNNRAGEAHGIEDLTDVDSVQSWQG